MTRGFQIKALSEFAIHTNNMDAMVRFYRDMLGLEPFGTRAGGAIEFFRVGDGYEGLTSVIALFDAGAERNVVVGRGVKASSLHHIALAVSRGDQDQAEKWFAKNNIETRIEEFSWVGWRGLFVSDPDGNTVELVAGDMSVYDPEA